MSLSSIVQNFLVTYLELTAIVFKAAVNNSMRTVTGFLVNMLLDVLATDTKFTTEGTSHRELVANQYFMFLKDKKDTG